MARDAVATMGAILPDDVGGRDAVHVAVVAAEAQTKLVPGQDVGYLQGLATTADPIGIVDPFLKSAVQPGQRFWLYLYPRTITGLNHYWTHPAFPDARPSEAYAPPAAKLASEQWLRDFCESADCPGYDKVMRLISEGDYIDGDEPGYPAYYCGKYDNEYLHFGGSEAHGEIPPEFWTHAENVLGKKLTKRPTYFSCSC